MRPLSWMIMPVGETTAGGGMGNQDQSDTGCMIVAFKFRSSKAALRSEMVCPTHQARILGASTQRSPAMVIRQSTLAPRKVRPLTRTTVRNGFVRGSAVCRMTVV
jgi:hypothetical protein